jgi:hypothetical protein
VAEWLLDNIDFFFDDRSTLFSLNRLVRPGATRQRQTGQQTNCNKPAHTGANHDDTFRESQPAQYFTN